MIGSKHWHRLLDRLGQGMALVGIIGIAAVAASLTATTAMAWSVGDYSITTSSFASSAGAGSASQQAAPGQYIYDTATLTSAFEYIQGGTLTFYLYQGAAPASCSGFNYSGSGALTSYTVTVANTSTGPTSGGLTESLSSLSTTPSNTGFKIPTTAANGSGYYWVAVYTDGSEPLQQHSFCNSEPVTVAVPLPTLGVTTQTTLSSVGVGSGVGDSATVSNYAALLADDSQASGSVNFSLYQGDSCSGTPVYQSGPETLSPSGEASTPTNAYIVPSAGPYQWQAKVTVTTSSGWPAIQPFSSACLDEPLSVQADTALETSAWSTPGLVGTWASFGARVSDTATVTGGDEPTGSVIFSLYSNASCTGSPVYVSGSVKLNGGHATSASYVVDQAGTWEWTASYSGDAYNSPSTSTCGNEPFSVGRAAPSITTVTSNGTTDVPVGTQIDDTANVSNSTNGTANSASGDVYFHLYQGGSGPVPECNGGSVFNDVESLTVGQPFSTATSADYQVTSLGHYDWTVQYEGDGNDTNGSSKCGSESVDVVMAAPTIITINNSHAVVGSSITDEAEITGGYQADSQAKVTFGLYQNDVNGYCSGLVGQTSVGWVNSNGDAFSAPIKVTQTGEYFWMDTYSGNGLNQSVTSSCKAEPVWVTSRCIEVRTVQQAMVVTSADTSVRDTAILSDFYPNPTDPTGYNGGVEFELFGPAAANAPAQCQWGSGGDMVFQSNWEPVYDIGGQYEATVSATVGAALVPGDYYWEAQYTDPGQTFDSPASAGCGELTVVTQSTPTLVTTPSSGGAIGTTLTDSATVTSAVEASGDPATDTLTFQLVSSCPSVSGAAPAANTVVSNFGAITATASFDSATGTYTYSASVPPSGYKSTAAGTYYWNVSFSGDTYNTAVTNQCGEPVSVVSVPVGGVLGASTPITGADLYGPGLAGALAMLLGGLLLIVGRRVLRVRSR